LLGNEVALMRQKPFRHEHCVAWAAGLFCVAGAIATLCLGVPGDAVAARGAKGQPGAARTAPARGFAARPAGSQRDLGRPPGRAGERGRGEERNPGALARGLARNGLPRRPFPGEPGFTGVPPRGETRFVAGEMIVHVGPEISPQTLAAAARRLGLTAIGSQSLAVTGGMLVHYRIAGALQVADAIRALEAERIGIAQPNYVFRLQQHIAPGPLAAGQPPNGDPAQYVVAKLQLTEVHRLATGANVPVAVIDSQVDGTHPDLMGSIAGQFDAIGAPDNPDEHGTGMTGAIAAHRRLVGVAPRARILAVHAFGPNAKNPQQATSRSIVAGIDWAIENGARIINMSFAGPYDPMLQIALKKAHDKGVVLIAAAGNMGPQSPPLFPAADENVIAVTALDQNDGLLPQANQGPHIALAAPGVAVLEAAPYGAYNLTTGTSVAAAHVSGVAALILERNPAIDVAALERLLFSTAKDLGPPGRDNEFGYGLVDPYRALTAAADAKVAGPPPQSPPPQSPAAKSPVAKSPVATSPVATSPVAVGAPAENASLRRAILAPGPAAAPAAPAAPAASQKTSLPPRLSEFDPSPSPATASASAAGEPEEVEAAIRKKRQACRQEVVGRGVRGPDVVDQVTACVAEARLACLKQAVVQKVRSPDRRDFISRCLAGS